MYYLNLDEDGYLLSVYTLGESETGPADAPALESLDGLDLSGSRIRAYRWDGSALSFDEERYEAVSAAQEKAPVSLAERVAALEAENTALTSQLTETQLALCDVYEQMLAATAAGEV